MLGPAPFVLLDDARSGGADARLYRDPVRIVTAKTPDEVRSALAALDAARVDGLHAAGYLAYEAGHALEPKLGTPAVSGPLLWFGLFRDFETIAADDVAARLPDPAGAWLGRPRPGITRAAYDTAFARVHEWIEAGDIYQANLSFRASVRVLGDPLAAYAAIRGRAAAGYGGIVWTGDDWLLSFSPELFFALRDGELIARPMKGTTPRGATPETDEAAKATLATDPKQRAENLMIVDLMRNDLARVCTPGSVRVPELFAVESFANVHHLVSTVVGRLAPGKGAVDLLRATFPPGSITGAPKVQAMKTIASLEAPRGPYCGSLFWAGFDGAFDSSVLIRTAAFVEDAGGWSLEARAGAGIVADSDPHAERLETEAKIAALARALEEPCA